MRITSIFLRTSFKGVVSRNYTNGFKMLSIIFSFITFHSQYPRETIAYFYRPQRSWGKVMFLQASVILSTGGEYLTRYPPRTRHTPPGPGTTPLGPGTPPLGPGTPPRTTGPGTHTPPPPAQNMLGDTVNARAVRILLECNLVTSVSCDVSC